MISPARSQSLRWIEVTIWVLAGVLLTSFGTAQVLSAAAQQQAIAAVRFAGSTPDQSLWSGSRVRRYEAARVDASAAPVLGILSAPSIGLEAAVFDGATDRNLNLGIARVEGTAKVGERGNLGIAGHRDGYFRALRNIAKGDELQLETVDGDWTYRVVDIFVVDPDDVYVLEAGTEQTITLITCYPFYFVGNAPRRFIVRAVAESTVFSNETS